MIVCQKACYALMNLISCSIGSVDSESFWTIEASISEGCEKSVSELKHLLLDELLDYSLREKISEKTEPIRNLILSNAFSNSGLVDQ